jgi:hypothetical protein
LSDESLFREVDEEVRREQAAKLWERYGNYVVALSVGIIVAVAAFKGWQYWQNKQAEEAGSAYFGALSLLAKGKTEEAQKAFEKLASGGHYGYATLARLQEAASLAGLGKTEEAVKAYDAIAADSSVDAKLRDLARIRAGYLLAGSASLDELKKRLEPLDRPDGSWVNAVREIIAAAAYRAGDYKEADRRMNEILADPQAPQGARQRAQIMVQLLAPLLTEKRAQAQQ